MPWAPHQGRMLPLHPGVLRNTGGWSRGAAAVLPVWRRWPWPVLVAGREGVHGQDAVCRGGSRWTQPCPCRQHCRDNLLPARGPDPRQTPRPMGGSGPMGDRGDGVLRAAAQAPACAIPYARVPRGLGRTGQRGTGPPQRCPTRMGLTWGCGAEGGGGALWRRGAGAALHSCRCPQSQPQPLLRSHPSLLQPLPLPKSQYSPSTSSSLVPAPIPVQAPTPVPSPPTSAPVSAQVPAQPHS